jgi:DNA-binding transcriptional regulator YiaG
MLGPARHARNGLVVHSRCSVVATPLAWMARPVEAALIEQWTGVEVRALRRAYRMTVRGFAERLGIGVRTVAGWEAKRDHAHLRPESHEMLDTFLRQAPQEVQQRFTALLTDTDSPAPAAAGLPVPAQSPFTWQPEDGGMDAALRRREFIGAALTAIGFFGTYSHRRGPRAIGRADVEAVQELVDMFGQIDQRRGGGHARGAVVGYLASDVAECLRGHFADSRVRAQMFAAGAELAYMAGWMAFDDADHSMARQQFHLALALAGESGDPAIEGHILRAMAHQAIDLGDYRRGVVLARASVEDTRYKAAVPRERALLGVVHARATASAGATRGAAAVLGQAEADLAAAASSSSEEPARVGFFGEASLAHETARTLSGMGDIPGALREFDRSIRTRQASAFTRTHAVTLGYLAALHARRDEADQACETWRQALDAMDGIDSGRTRQVATDMIVALPSLRARGVHPDAADELDARARSYLTTGTTLLPAAGP